MEDHPSTHRLLKGEERRVESLLNFRAKPRNPRVRRKRMEVRGKTTRLIMTLISC